MYRHISPNLVRPNLPLRKPSSSPMAHPHPIPLTPPRRPLPDALLVRPATGAIGDSPINSPVTMDQSAVFGYKPPALTVYYCNYCGQQGNFRCKRCKKTPYCSVVCQTEDWKAHRHLCKTVEEEPTKEKPNETTASPVTAEKAGPLEYKHDDASSLKRVYLKDLHVTKIIKGTDIQASVVEFYSPGRFFLLAQSPELLEAFQSISAELRKTYSCPSVKTYVPQVGEICAVQFSADLNWYRGLVKTLTADQKTVNILYIDFGNEEDVPVERIKPLAANIQLFSPCAMECRIAKVVSVTDNWSDECCIAVKQMLAGKTVTVELVETIENGRIHIVDILLSMGKNLSGFLLEHGYAAEETVDITPTEQEITMGSASLQIFKCLSDGKDDNTWAQPPKPLTQATGDKFSVVVTDVQSPNDVIVQKVDNLGVIRDLQLKLREHCSQALSPQNFRPAPGTVCCAQFSEDKQWYRAEVMAYSSEKRVYVTYLDFGNTEEVDLGHLQPISASLLAFPMQAIPCSLAGVQPVEGSWSKECLMALQRMVSNRILHVEIQGAHDGKALVAMIDEASDPQANVAELLTSAGFAAAPAHPTASGEQQVEQTAAADAELHVPTPASEPLVWSCIELPCDGQTVALLPSVVENPSEFYCRINNPTDHQLLIELGAELKLHCEAEASSFVPKLGEPCCALFSGDGKWYRAMVNELSEEVSVNFVDYGYGMKVDKNHLRSITPQLLTLPFQAVRCWLTGVEPLGSEWSSEALLWFQTQVDGEQLTARVLSNTEQGYGVELQSRGQNVAAALISEQLAKAPGTYSKEMHAITGSGDQNNIPASELKQMHVQASIHTGEGSKAIPTEGRSTMLSEAPSFPVDWKTVELPLNETFEPCIVASNGPSLFYLLSPSQVDQQKLQEVMMEVASYCSNIQASLSSAVLTRPAPGAACCAKFSADNNWYRAVVVEVGENEMSIVYADYGNTEKVQFSRILPIPVHLLQLPFQVTRCALIGKEQFPAEFPKEVLQIFQSLLLNGVRAAVKSYDGCVNMLSLTLRTENGGGDISAMILDALEAQAKSNPYPSTTHKAEPTDSSKSAVRAMLPDCTLSMSKLETKKELQNSTATSSPTVTIELTTQPPQQKTNTSTASVNEDPVQKVIKQVEPPCEITNNNETQTTGCCCLNLTNKIDHLEQLMQLQLSLIQQIAGQTK